MFTSSDQPRVGPVAIAISAFVAVLLTNLVSLGLDHLRRSLLNANWQFSWSHDADTLLLAAGVGASILGARTSRAERPPWILSGTILGLLFLDEVSALHGQLANLEKLAYAPFLIVLVVCAWRVTARTTERGLVRAGLTILLFAFAMHAVGLHTLRPIGYTSYVYQIGVAAKEGAELTGLILLVSALWRRARAQRYLQAY